jgi:ubiquinone/menaquinone biosynthesis C-methylase UbiE
MQPRAHWSAIYRAKSPTEVSWYEPAPTVSLEYIRSVGLKRDAGIVDVGGGASLLVDHLLGEGFERITVVDIAEEALARARERLGARAATVCWLKADVRRLRLREPADLWHDRAVFHFLTEPADRQSYLGALKRGLRPGGHLVMATFAADGPTMCSGLPVARYDAEALARTLGKEFELRRSSVHEHLTPSGGSQRFQYGLFRRRRR